MSYEEAGWVRRLIWGLQDNTIEILTIAIAGLLIYYLLL